MHPKNAVVVQLLLLLVCVCVATKDLWALPACIARFLNSGTTEYAYRQQCESDIQTTLHGSRRRVLWAVARRALIQMTLIESINK